MNRDGSLPHDCKDIIDTLQTVRVIDKSGKHLGIMALFEAWKLADNERAELIKIGPSCSPPVYRMINSREHQTWKRT